MITFIRNFAFAYIFFSRASDERSYQTEFIPQIAKNNEISYFGSRLREIVAPAEMIGLSVFATVAVARLFSPALPDAVLPPGWDQPTRSLPRGAPPAARAEVIRAGPDSLAQLRPPRAS